MSNLVKLNVGCGADYREGFVNIDGSNALSRVDKIIEIPRESLLDHFQRASCQFILANDVVEHMFRWEAISLIKQFYALLACQGLLEIRVPDTEFIIRSWRIPLQKKIILLYGGQDVHQGGPAEMEASRNVRPDLFCHKYGWTKQSLGQELAALGFTILSSRTVGTNFVIKATK